jgi:hypothetical protein
MYEIMNDAPDYEARSSVPALDSIMTGAPV